VKYLALVAACLLAVGLASPATADDTPDPAQVTFPSVSAINPDHTPYVLSVSDPQPDLGELVVRWADQSLSLPHEGDATVPLTAADADPDGYAVLQVLRCPAGSDCVAVGSPHGVELVTRLGVWLEEGGNPLGQHAVVPIDSYWPGLADGDVVHLDWQLTAARDGVAITSGSGSYVIGDLPPALDIPPATTATYGVLSVRAVSDSAAWGRLEGTSSDTYRLDLQGPPIPVTIDGDVVFPAKDGYLDAIPMRFGSTPYDLQDLRIDLVDRDGTVIPVHRGTESKGTTVMLTGRYKHEVLPAGRYTLRLTGYDAAGNTTVRDHPVRIDDRVRVERTYRKTIPAARTVSDTFVGACSHLGPAAGRGWKGSLGLYSTTPCAKKNGSVVVTVHGARVPASVGGYPRDIMVSLYGGAARGSHSAYLVQGWFRASDGEFIGRRQFDGRMRTHEAYGADAADVVRTIDGRQWVYWQLGLSEGSRYDVKSFTVSTKYYVLVPPASRTASDAKTIAEPSGAPGPGYTVPKTDAAEFPAAYRPAM
jgi:hypothetical protein